MFLISNFRRVLNAVCFLLGDSRASEIYMSTFRNTLSVPSPWVVSEGKKGAYTAHEDGTDRVFRNVGIKIQTPDKYPEERIQQAMNGFLQQSLKKILGAQKFSHGK